MGENECAREWSQSVSSIKKKAALCMEANSQPKEDGYNEVVDVDNE
jgi:hypothetical protein